ncbi:amidohydrolase [Burkholderia sp. Bp9143]|uniref:amidohydrolase family protein n=1 Tax=Burkholderia sp. Bp9143 TaxID=2184574 RepID=UPI000F59D298|nr:amidohydrolase family protein [Burkholderia sp. Bp9143]RQR27803.1 amidohydrolase [Burkholderia sp. Bp9143]
MNRIDVHHHFVPPVYQAAMSRHGLKKVAGAELPAWSEHASLDVMDANAIRVALLSISAPGVYFGNLEDACSLARACNEYAAELRERHPDRFGSFAVLPMPFTEHACKEAIHALDVLKADGVVLLGSTEGRFLGSPEFDELMAELDSRRAVVFVHPNLHRSSEELGLIAPGFLIEFLCDTTRAALNLILTGTIERYPNICWILAHAGGFLPYVAWRLSLANLLPEFVSGMPAGMLTYIRRFHFDTALSPAEFPQAALRELVGPSQILFGSDFPFAPAPATAMQCAALERSPIWHADARLEIDSGNALRLFSRLGGTVAGAPTREVGPLISLRRAAVGASVRLIDRLRNR